MFVDVIWNSVQRLLFENNSCNRLDSLNITFYDAFNVIIECDMIIRFIL